MDEMKLEVCLELFKRYEVVKEKQKSRGLNDYNIFTTLLQISDEVRLHSKFIHSLIDPDGLHYQGTLFLELFLEQLNLSYFFEDLDMCFVKREYENIDLYISDGQKHIIIENKVFAGEQTAQVQRYIDLIKEFNQVEEEFNDNLVVVYLTLDGHSPSHDSLNDFSLENQYLIRSEECYRFIPITYGMNIKNWVENCLSEVSNITNLSNDLSAYHKVILMLYNNYQGKVMTLKEYISKRDNSHEIFRLIKSISKEYIELRQDLIKEFLDKVLTQIAGELSGSSWYLDIVDQEHLYQGKREHFPVRIRHDESDDVVFGFEFQFSDYYGPSWGIVRTSRYVDFKEIETQLQDYLVELDITLTRRSYPWWLKWGNYSKGDIFEKIIECESVSDAAQEMVNEWMRVFHSCEQTIMKCNQLLGKKVGYQAGGLNSTNSSNNLA